MMKQRDKWVGLTVSVGLAAAVVALAGEIPPRNISSWRESPQGVVVAEGDPLRGLTPYVAGSTFLRKYEIYQPHPDKHEDREKNRETVKKFFALPMGDEAAHLYAKDGLKRLPNLGLQWRGWDALEANNKQNAKLFEGFNWTDIVIWDTQDPSVFWVENKGVQDQDNGFGKISRHYLVQFVVKNGQMKQMTEYALQFAEGQGLN